MRRQPKVALLEVPPKVAFSILSVLSHHPVWVLSFFFGGERRNEIKHEMRVNRKQFVDFEKEVTTETHHSLGELKARGKEKKFLRKKGGLSEILGNLPVFQ